MATNSLVYDRTYNLGSDAAPWRVRIRLSLRSLPLWTSGSETNDANLAANSEAEIDLNDFPKFGAAIDAKNVPGLRKLANVSFAVLDTADHVFRDNILLPAVAQASSGLRLCVRFDCAYGYNDRGAWNSGTAYDGVNDCVTSGGVVYHSILAGTNHAPPNATYWEVINSVWLRDFTGILDPQQYEGPDYEFADFANNEMNYHMKFTGIDFAQIALEQLPMSFMPSFGPEYPDSSLNMFVSITAGTYFKRAPYYYWHTSWRIPGAGTPANFDENAYQSGGAWTDLDFAPLDRIFRTFANFYRWCLDGNGAASTLLAYDITMDHFTCRSYDVFNPGTMYEAGNGVNDLATRVALNKHTFVENTGVDYREYNLDAVYDPNGNVSGGNCRTAAESLNTLAQSFLLFVNMFVDYGAAGAERVNLRVTSPVSPTVKSFVSGDPELVALMGSLKTTPGFTPAGSASVGIKKPAGIDHEYMVDTPQLPDDPHHMGDYQPFDDSVYDLFSPTYSAPLAFNAGIVTMTSIVFTGWCDYPENLLTFFLDPSGPVPDIIGVADFDMLLGDTGTYPDNAPNTVTLTWGGGSLTGGIVRADAQTYQHGAALQLFSLYCGGVYGTTLKGIERVQLITPITGREMAANLADAILRKVLVRGADGNTHLYLITGVEWSSWNVRDADARTVTITAVRNVL